MFRLYVLLLLLLLCGTTAQAKVSPEKYGVTIPVSSVELKKMALAKTDSILKAHPQVSHKVGYSAILNHRGYSDKTGDFYLLVALCIMLGLIRYSDPRYFNGLLRAFWNPTQGSRQLKDQLQAMTFPNLLMNVFFTMAGGAYIYYVARVFTPQRSGNIPPSILIVMLIAGMMVIYLGKYAVVRFSGWAFRLEEITDFYLFNVFLINKIIAIAMLPFIVLLAFADPVWTQPLTMVSFVLIGILLINRYTRSWQVFGSFFQYSKFHFFTYLCASELLPLAVLMKLLVEGIMYY